MKIFLAAALGLFVFYWFFVWEEEPTRPPLFSMGQDTSAEKTWMNERRPHYRDLYDKFEKRITSAVWVVREAERSCRAVFIENQGGSGHQDMEKYLDEEWFSQRAQRCDIFSAAAGKISEAVDVMLSQGEEGLSDRELYYFDWLKGSVGGFNVEQLQSGLDVGPFLNKADCNHLAQNAVAYGFHVSYCRPYDDTERGMMFSLLSYDRG